MTLLNSVAAVLHVVDINHNTHCCSYEIHNTINNKKTIVWVKMIKFVIAGIIHSQNVSIYICQKLEVVVGVYKLIVSFSKDALNTSKVKVKTFKML